MSGRIVVGVDGSRGARAALEWAIVEARLRGASLEAVHAWRSPAVVIAGPFGAPPVADDDTTERARKAAEHLLEKELQAVDTGGV